MGFQNADLVQAKHGLKGKDSMDVVLCIISAVQRLLCYGFSVMKDPPMQ